jgi:hypothetical protein
MITYPRDIGFDNVEHRVGSMASLPCPLEWRGRVEFSEKCIVQNGLFTRAELGAKHHEHTHVRLP